MAMSFGSFPAAEDAVQEALARAWERSERGEWIESLPAFVVTVARNLLRDRFRRLLAERRARRELEGRIEERSAVAPSTERMDLTRALAGLPPRQREVVVYHYVLDLEVVEVARILGMPEGTVKSSLFRARRTLAAALDVHEGDAQEVDDAAR